MGDAMEETEENDVEETNGSSFPLLQRENTRRKADKLEV